MFTRIDWLSFSVTYEPPKSARVGSALNLVMAAIRQLAPMWDDASGMDESWGWGGGRKPYSTSWRSADGGFVVFFHPKLPHALVEISGRGCEALGQRASARAFLEVVRHRVTRIDIASDIETDIDPRAFAAKRAEGRFKSTSEVVSESGITCYVGSRSSNRYARVYRYAEPHKRAGLLRVEHVVKAEDAKSMVSYILENDAFLAQKALGEAFGWQHDAWIPEAQEAPEFRAFRSDRGGAKTIHWLANTVAPVIARLDREGTLSWLDFYHDFVLPLLSDEPPF